MTSNDVSKCPGESKWGDEHHICPLRKQCYRYTVTPDKYSQSYSNFFNPDSPDKCSYFIDNDISSKLEKGADVSSFGDPLEWQKEVRKDRKL